MALHVAMSGSSRAPYAGRSPAKNDEENVTQFGPAKRASKAAKTGSGLAEKMPAGTSPTPPPRTKVTPEVSDLSPPAPEKEQAGDIQVRLQSLEMEMAHLNANFNDNVQAAVGAAVLAALAQEREKTPAWATELQASVLSLKEDKKQIEGKIGACEGQLLALQAQMDMCAANTHPIYLAERAAMLATAEQTRISGVKEQDGEKFLKDYMKTKFPNSSKISVTKSGPAFVATFASADEAKKVAKALKQDHKDLLVRPQLPPLVLESQGPLKRAFAALAEWVKTEASADFPVLSNYKINFMSRAITDGQTVLARQLADGCVQPNLPVLGQGASNAVLLASQDRDYFYNLKSQKDGIKDEKAQKEKGKGKGKGKGKKGKGNDMEVDTNLK